MKIDPLDLTPRQKLWAAIVVVLLFLYATRYQFVGSSHGAYAVNRWTGTVYWLAGDEIITLNNSGTDGSNFKPLGGEPSPGEGGDWDQFRALGQPAAAGGEPSPSQEFDWDQFPALAP